MKKRLEIALHVATAAVSVATPFALDPVSAGLVFAGLSLAAAVKAGLM